MEHTISYAKILKVDDNGILVDSVPRKQYDYRGEMYFHTEHTELLNRFDERRQADYFVKGEYVKYITNGIMTMSLPPQLNPSLVQESFPINTIYAKLLSIKDNVLEFAVTDDNGFFLDNKINLNFNDESYVLNKEIQTIDLDESLVEKQFEVLIKAPYINDLTPFNILRLKEI